MTSRVLWRVIVILATVPAIFIYLTPHVVAGGREFTNAFKRAWSL